MSCEITAEALNAYVDDLLTIAEQEKVEQHLAECPRCNAMVAALAQEGAAIRTALSVDALTLPPSSYGPSLRSWMVPLWRVAAVVALVLGTSLGSVWLYRMAVGGAPETPAVGRTVTRLVPRAEAPRLTVCVRKGAAASRVVPATFLVPLGLDAASLDIETDL